jgi:hypothetical protein
VCGLLGALHQAVLLCVVAAAVVLLPLLRSDRCLRVYNVQLVCMHAGVGLQESIKRWRSQHMTVRA